MVEWKGLAAGREAVRYGSAGGGGMAVRLAYGVVLAVMIATEASALTMTTYAYRGGAGELRVEITHSLGGPTATTLQEMTTAGEITLTESSSGLVTLSQPLVFEFGPLTASHPDGFTVGVPALTIIYDMPWSGPRYELEAGVVVEIQHAEYDAVPTFDLNGENSQDGLRICDSTGSSCGGLRVQLVGDTIFLHDAANRAAGLINVATGYPNWHLTYISANPGLGGAGYAVPEPSTAVLMAVGLVWLCRVFVRRRSV